MQIPILSGAFTDDGADWRTSYPLNLVPVPVNQQGLSLGYLRTTDGLVQFALPTLTGADRGSINWQNVCYRVIGPELVRVNADGSVDSLGKVNDDGKKVTLTYSFDRLAIASAGQLFYYLPPGSGSITGVKQVTDSNLGLVLDVIWIAGYFMTTDGNSLVVTDLNDPFTINPLQFGSSEASPDPINSLAVIRNEVKAVNRYTTETFQNIGGDGIGFPFQRVDGAMLPKGSIGTQATNYFMEDFAFVGGGSGEPLSVYICRDATANKIGSREVETILLNYTDAQVEAISVEARNDKASQFLYIHLPDQTLVYDDSATQVLGQLVWHRLASGPNATLPYRARNFVFCYNKWLFGDLQSQRIGTFTTADARQFGETVPYEFDTLFLYNSSMGAIVHSLELVRLPGRSALSPIDPPPTVAASIFLSFTDDGLKYSNPRPSPLSIPGQTDKRTQWRGIGRMKNLRAFRFRGMNNPYPDSFARLEAVVEALNA